MATEMDHLLIWPLRALSNQVVKVGKFCTNEEEAATTGYFWVLDFLPVQEIGHVACGIFTAAVGRSGNIAC